MSPRAQYLFGHATKATEDNGALTTIHCEDAVVGAVPKDAHTRKSRTNAQGNSHAQNA